MKNCFEQLSYNKAVTIIMKNKDDPRIKELILYLLDSLVIKDDNQVDEIVVKFIKERLYPSLH
jgi:hypothetical protein